MGRTNHRSIRIQLRRGVVCAAAVVVVSALAICPSQAFARSFEATHVVSDENMRDYQSMSASQIQSFLDSHSGPLKRMSFSRHDSGSIAPASVIIWEAAQAWRISPKVLLTMLQKEQSLLTRRSLAKQTLNRAVGAGCPDSGGNRYPGFGNQIWNGARLLDGYGEPGKTTDYVPHPWKPGLANKFTRWVHTENIATYKLYVYNPSIGAHRPYGDLSKQSCSGNANFWKIYWHYFGNPLSVPRSGPVDGLTTATVVLSRPFGRSQYGGVPVVTGRLVVSDSSVSVSGAEVRLERMTAGGWDPVAGALVAVEEDGLFSFSLQRDHTDRVRVTFAGTAVLSPAVSGCFVSEVAPIVATPSVRSRTSSKKPTTVRGTIVPAHAGTVKVSVYRRKSGAWRTSKTYSVRSTGSGRWVLRVRLAKGTSRLKATHADGGHALGVSPWARTTAK